MTEATVETQLDALESQATELDTTPEQKAAEAAEAEQEADQQQGARAAADITVSVLAQLLEMAAPVAAVDKPTQKTAVDKLAPVFEKYGIGLGSSSRWAAEIDAAIFFGVTGFTCWQKIQAAKAEEQEKGGQGGDEREHQPKQ